MPDAIACSCGYRGPAVSIAGRSVCPICHTPAASRASAASAAAPAAPTRPPSAASAARARPTSHRIPCPRGHVLTAGEHMLGQQVVCPECNELFLLRREDSLEQRRRREREREAEEERLARLWLRRAIWAGVLVVVWLVGMIAFSLARRPSAPAGPPSAPAPAARTG